MTDSYAEAMRRRLQGAQYQPAPVSTAVPGAPAAAANLNFRLAKLKAAQVLASGGGAMQSQRIPQGGAAQMAYTQQANRVHGAPGSTQNPVTTPGMPVPVTPEVAQTAIALSQPPVVAQPPVVPQGTDRRFFELNTQFSPPNVDVTPPETTAAQVAEAEQITQDRVVARYTELYDEALAITGDPLKAEMIAKDQVIAENMAYMREHPELMPQGGWEAVPAFIGDLIDKPRQLVVEEMGANAYDVATGKKTDWGAEWAAVAPGNWMIPGLDATRFTQDFETWAENPDNWLAIQNASEQGFQATPTDPRYTGGRAVWELFINTAGLAYKGFADILLDPTIIAGMGKSVGDPLVESAVRTAAADENLPAAAIKYATGKLLAAPQTVLDATVDAPLNALGRGFTDLVTNRGTGRTGRVLGQFAEPTEARAASQIAATDEALIAYERLPGQGPNDIPPVGDGAIPPPDQPPGNGRYTAQREGDQWVIYDPAGNPTDEVYPYRTRTGTERNVEERAVIKRVNELNKPIIRAEGIEMGAVLPAEDAGLTWTDPSYDRITLRGADLPMTVQARVAYGGSLDPALRRQWMDEWVPKAREHEAVMADIRVRETEDAIRTGTSLERDYVQRGTEIVSPLKTYETVRFLAEDTLTPFVRTFPGEPVPAYRWITSPELQPKNPSNLIEHAVFGTREEAIQARKLLRAGNVNVEGFRAPRDFVERLAQMGEELHGAGWRSTDPTAVKSRELRARAAAQPTDVAAAMGDLGLPASARGQALPPNPAVEAVETITERAATPPEMPTSVLDAPQPTKPKGKRPTATVDTAADDRAIVQNLTDSAVRWTSPGKNKIQRGQAGIINVEKPGLAATRAEQVEIVPVPTKEGTIWTVRPRSAAKPEVRLAALGDAIALADELILRAAQGIEPVKQMIEKAMTDLGIVSAATRRNLELEAGIRQSILRREGALDGPINAEADALARVDRSHVGAAYLMGAPGLDGETYLRLSRWVDYNGERVRLWEAYDRALHDAPWTMTATEQASWARQQVAEQTIDPLTRAELTAADIRKTNRGKVSRALHRALRGYEIVLKFLRESILFNWAKGFGSAMADGVGTAYSLLINNEPMAALRGALDARSARHFIQDQRGKQRLVDSLPGVDRYQQITGKLPSSTHRMFDTRFETGAGPLELERFGKAYKFLRPIADKDIAAFRTGMERNNRFALEMTSFDRYLAREQTRFRGIVATRAERTGNSPSAWLQKLDDLGDSYNGKDVFDAFGDSRLATDWAGMVNRARTDAKKRVDDLLFTYKQLSVDNKLKNFIFFHYWMSRAAILHSKTALKNPWLINAYARAWDFMEREAEQNGYPPSVRGFIRLMGSEAGMYGLINPINVLVPFSVLVENNQDEGTFAFLQRWGLFINPLIEAGAASLGWTDGVPDITGTRQVRRAARVAVNWLNSNGFDGVVPDWLGDPNSWRGSFIDKAEYRIYDGINSLLHRAANWMDPTQQFINEYEGSDPNAYEQDVLRSIAITHLEESYGPFETWTADSPVWDELQQVIDDVAMGREASSPLAAEVIEEYGDDRKDGIFWNGAIPGGLYQRYGPRDQTLAEARAGEEQAWDQRDIAVAGNPPLTIGLAQLDRVGTEDGRWGYARINEIVYAEGADLANMQLVFRDGTILMGWQLQQMSEDQRRELATEWVKGWIDPQEVEDYRAERETFLAAHPEVGDFKEYQKGVGNYDGGTKAWRTQYARRDPAFAEAMAAEEDRQRGYGKTGAVLDAELDSWAMTPEAYNIANGYQNEIYDAPQTPKVPEYGFGGSGGGTSAPAEPKDPMARVRTTITTYQEKVAEGIAAMQAAGYSVTEADVYSSNPYYRSIFAQYGIPEMGEDVWLYQGWVAMQPPGRDTSVDAYLSYLRQLGQKAA